MATRARGGLLFAMYEGGPAACDGDALTEASALRRKGRCGDDRGARTSGDEMGPIRTNVCVRQLSHDVGVNDRRQVSPDDL